LSALHSSAGAHLPARSDTHWPLGARLTMVVVSAMIFCLLEGVATRTRWIDDLHRRFNHRSFIAAQRATDARHLRSSGLAQYSHRRGRALEAGLILGMLCVKPHFALAAMLLLFAIGQRKMLAGMVVTGAACVVAGGAREPSRCLRVCLTAAAFVRGAGKPHINVRSEQNLLGLTSSFFDVYGGPIISLTARRLR
jgi:hypothetical protein